MELNRRKTDTDPLLRDITALMDLMPAGIRWVNRAGECEYINQAFCDMFGYRLSEIRLMDDWFLRAYPDPDSRKRIVDWYSEKIPSLARGTTPPPLQAAITCRDGSVKQVIVSAHIALGRVIAIYTDITDHAKAIERQLEVEKMFRVTFEGARDAIFWIMAESGTLVNCNRAAEELYGAPRNEIIGRHFTSLHPPDTTEHVLSLFEAVATIPEPRDDTEAELLDRSGRRIPVLIRASMTSIEERSVVQAVFLDISERKRADKYRVELAAERIALEEQRQFLGLVSHELRTPLSIIDGAAQLILLTAPPSSTSFAQAERIRSATVRLSELIDGCLTDDRLSTSGWRPDLRELDIVPLVLGAVDQSRAKAQGHTFETVLDASPVRYVCDPTLIGIMLSNLLDNALKYSPGGGTITLASSCRENGSLLFEISDQGIGIPPDQLEKIYNRFHRTWQIQGVPGAGLGLSLVKRIAEIHGGSVACRSTLGAGSTFTVTLPPPVR